MAKNTDSGSVKQSLFDKILSDENIYNAIFSVESYVCNPTLLEKKDLKDFYQLHDHFDNTLMRSWIKRCRERLINILSHKDALFGVKVYFRLKKFDDNTNVIKYRPIHSASLEDQICMVCLLQPLMFEDRIGRKKSDLGNKIPANFYGYVPSESVDRIFEEWTDRFADYNREIVNRSKRYRTSHEYRAEVTLDIKNFFPSVDPEFIVDYVVTTLSGRYEKEEDINTLHNVVRKLLYLKIAEENVSGWEPEYYGKELNENGLRLAKGIAQGLPQSYFFGNLAMVTISEIIRKSGFFDGVSLYYVDDSVIYIKTNHTQSKFTELIIELNKGLSEAFKINNSKTDNPKDLISEEYVSFHRNLEYQVRFHEDDKSRICHIDDTGWNLMGLPKEASDDGIYRLLDEVDQNIAAEKVSTLEKYVSNYIAIHDHDYESIQDLKSIPGHELSREKFDELSSDKSEADKKILKRYRKLFLYQLSRLNYEQEGKINPKELDEFEKSFKSSVDIFDDETRKKWFAEDDGSRFQAESRLLIRNLPLERARHIVACVAKIEKNVSGKDKPQTSSLYQWKDARGTFAMKYFVKDRYASLGRMVKMYYSDRLDTSIENRKEDLLDFIDRISGWIGERQYDFRTPGMIVLPEMTFALRNSDEMKRQLLNAFFSFISGFDISDDMVLVKKNGRPVDYSEFRILAKLRNKRFKFRGFRSFVENLDINSLDNKMSIDYGLVGILGTIVAKVGRPEWVDNVIVTHRITKSFWQNGSKFLNSYTLHNEEHAVTLIRKSVDLVKHIDYLELKQVDWLILFIACYLHDISMVIHPDLFELNDEHDSKAMALLSEIMDRIQDGLEKENSRIAKIENPDESDDDKEDAKKTNIYKETGNFMREVFEKFFSYFENKIRSEHPVKSAQFIIDKKDTVFSYLDPVFLHTVADVSRSHGEEIQSVYGVRSEAGSDSISEKYMKILIRLADLHDVANDRINYYLLRQNVEHMSPTSRFHWISHLVTDSIRLVPKYDLDYEIIDKNGKDYFSQYINETLVFELSVNVRCLAPMRLEKCKRCEGVVLPEKEINEDIDGGCITIEMGGRGKCRLESCPTICRWVMKKHEWLLVELNALSNYIMRVNQPMFRTKVMLKIIFKNELDLDKDLYDEVIKYLEES